MRFGHLLAVGFLKMVAFRATSFALNLAHTLSKLTIHDACSKREILVLAATRYYCVYTPGLTSAVFFVACVFSLSSLLSSPSLPAWPHVTSPTSSSLSAGFACLFASSFLLRSLARDHTQTQLPVYLTTCCASSVLPSASNLPSPSLPLYLPESGCRHTRQWQQGV